jgi:hypothetical protein
MKRNKIMKYSENNNISIDLSNKFDSSGNSIFFLLENYFPNEIKVIEDIAEDVIVINYYAELIKEECTFYDPGFLDFSFTIEKAITFNKKLTLSDEMVDYIKDWCEEEIYLKVEHNARTQ